MCLQHSLNASKCAGQACFDAWLGQATRERLVQHCWA